jgi:hypothetical protein
MDKLLNGVEALTSKSGLLSSLVGLAERFVPQTNASGDTFCFRSCAFVKTSICENNKRVTFFYAPSRYLCSKREYTRRVYRCGNCD